MKAKTSIAMMTAAVALLHSTFAETPDAFVEYVQSDGSQYIDTGIIGRCGTKADMTIQWMGGNDSSFLSSRIASIGTDDQKNTRFILCSNQGGNSSYMHYYTCHRKYDSSTDLSKSTYSTDKPDWIVSGITHDGTNVKYTMSVNGKEEISVERKEDALDTKLNMYLFAQNMNGSAILQSKVKCYSVKIWQDGNLVRDFRPCVKDGKAGLYDAVDEKIFYPQGGDLMPSDNKVKVSGKPDHFVQYVESSGTQYIDTGVVGKCNTSADMTIMWLSSADGAFLSSRISETGTDAEKDTRFNLCNNDTSSQYYTSHRTFISSAGAGAIAKCSTDRPDHIYSSITHDGTTMKLALYVNGATVQTRTATEEALDTGLNMYLFAQNLAGAAKYMSSVRCFGTKIWQDGNLVRDFRPCIKDGRAGLYDEVSGWIFFPQGGELIYPNEKPDKIMKWVNLTGSSYVDTQVRAKSGIRSEMQYWPSVDNIVDQYMLAARVDENNNKIRFLLGYYWNGSGYHDAVIGYKDVWNCAYWDNHAKEKVHTLVSEISSTGIVNGTCDGVKFQGNTQAMGDLDIGLNLYMFGLNLGGKAQDFFNGRSYYSKIWVWDESANDYVPVRDFVPCVKDDKVAFYDNVSQTMFYPFPAIPAEGNSQPHQGLIILFR